MWGRTGRVTGRRGMYDLTCHRHASCRGICCMDMPPTERIASERTAMLDAYAAHGLRRDIEALIGRSSRLLAEAEQTTILQAALDRARGVVPMSADTRRLIAKA